MTKSETRPNVSAATSAHFGQGGLRRCTLLTLALATAIGSMGLAAGGTADAFLGAELKECQRGRSEEG